MYLGGSLADDFGSVDSDIDVFCFTTAPAPPGPIRLDIGGQTSIEAHVIEVEAEIRRSESMAILITAADPPGPADWPLIPSSTFRALHALYRDRRLSTGSSAAERLRSALGGDVLPQYVALRATHAAVTLTLESFSLAGARSPLQALYRCRAAVDAAIDAALAHTGDVCPNAKYRLTAARRRNLFVENGGPLDTAAVFPDPSTPERSLDLMGDTVSALLSRVAADRFLARFPVVRDAAEIVRSTRHAGQDAR
jgi:hypothetical protein